MSEFFSQSFRSLMIVAAFSAFTSYAQAASAQSQLQDIADEAALAAVQALTSDSQGEAAKRADAIRVAQQRIGAIPGIQGEVTASVQDLIVTVKLSASDAKAKTNVAMSTARYISPEQPANWSWASRQYFAAARSPVVMGSTCSQDCGTDRVR